MRLEGVINHMLRRRIVRCEKQLIPRMLRTDFAADIAGIQAAASARVSGQAIPAGAGPTGVAPWPAGCMHPVPANAEAYHTMF